MAEAEGGWWKPTARSVTVVASLSEPPASCCSKLVGEEHPPSVLQDGVLDGELGTSLQDEPLEPVLDIAANQQPPRRFRCAPTIQHRYPGRWRIAELGTLGDRLPACRLEFRLVR